jgi:pilus assembly protein TadC
MGIESVYETVGRLIGRTRIRSVGRFLDAAGVNLQPEMFVGFFAILVLLLSILGTLLIIQLGITKGYLVRIGLAVSGSLTTTYPQFLLLLAFILSLIGIAVSVGLIAYTLLMLRIDARKKEVDLNLPDFLLLSAANVRAGMTVDQAMWNSAKPEFGVLSTEIELVAKRTFGGEPFDKALDRLAFRFNSKLLKRTVALVKQGLATGGKMADILERTADDAREAQLIQKDIAASLLMYVIFISFAACIGAPFLFSVSNRLIEMLEKIFLSIPPVENIPMGFLRPSPPGIRSDDFFLFTVAVTIITAIFSSLIIGIIQRGSKKEGVKYIPLFIAATLIVFFAASALLSAFLGGMGA